MSCEGSSIKAGRKKPSQNPSLIFGLWQDWWKQHPSYARIGQRFLDFVHLPSMYSLLFASPRCRFSPSPAAETFRRQHQSPWGKGLGCLGFGGWSWPTWPRGLLCSLFPEHQWASLTEPGRRGTAKRWRRRSCSQEWLGTSLGRLRSRIVGRLGF